MTDAELIAEARRWAEPGFCPSERQRTQRTEQGFLSELSTRLEAALERERRTAELMQDVWMQFSVEDSNESRWAGGLSTLEDVQEWLAARERVKG